MSNISQGSKGTEVTRLQKRLNELGYRNSVGAFLAEDGSFGQNTLFAVNAFKDKVLPGGNTGVWRGIVGEATWKALSDALPALPPELFWLPPFDLNDGGKPWSQKDIDEFVAFDYGVTNNKGELERFKMSWDGCVPKLIEVRKLFETECAKLGWRITYSSAYRPMVYQSHFWDIQNGSASKTEIGREHAKNPHRLSSLVSKPSRSSPHIAGVAWDCTVTDKSGRALNSMTNIHSDLLSLMLSVGLRKPPSNDNIHFQLVH
jgi:hypothetical protein